MSKFSVDGKASLPVLLLVLAAIGAIALVLLVLGAHNLVTLDTLSSVVESSEFYKAEGYESVSEWRSAYASDNWVRVLIGIGLLAGSGYLLWLLRLREKENMRRQS